MKQFKAHNQERRDSRHNHFQNPECELPFFSGRRFNRTAAAIGYTGRCRASAPEQSGGLMGKGKVVCTHEPSRLSLSTICNRRATNEVAEIQNGRVGKYKIASNP